jgi:hypothetical protein
LKKQQFGNLKKQQFGNLKISQFDNACPPLAGLSASGGKMKINK